MHTCIRMQHILNLIVPLLIFLAYYSRARATQPNVTTAYNIPDPECTGVFNLCTDVDKERLGRQAIKAIHEQMDDDKDGMIEATESQEFIQEELESKTDSVRHKQFQQADLQITFTDLWTQWQTSDVHNWTTENVVDWLVNYVRLPQYVDNFRRNQFDGRMIPRLASNEKHYLSAIMQIRDPRHKRRLIIKATDVVLFGTPTNTHNLLKDVILMSAVVISFCACLYAYVRHRKIQDNMKTMLKELETLQKAETDLVAVTGKMKAMENELKDKPKVDRGLLNTWFVEVQRTKEEAENFHKRRATVLDPEKQLRFALQEIEQLRIALRKAEEHAQHQSYEPPSELIELLKKTYLNEELAFEVKRKAAENAMIIAKEQMNKISKMQKGFFGAVRIAHTGCIDNISELISSAKERLREIQDEYEEREKRWNRIGSLLDREDLVSNSSSSSVSMTNNVYLNNGIPPSMSTEAISRSKQTSMDSISYDSQSITKPSNRTGPVNPIISIKTVEENHSSVNGNYLNHNDSPSTVLKRRTLANTNNNNNSSSSSELLGSQRQIISSQSAQNLNSTLRNSAADSNRDNNTDDSLDILLSNKSSKPIFDLMIDQQIDINDNYPDDQDQKSQISMSAYDDQVSISTPERKRKQFSSKLLKPFHNIRLRKKSTS